MKILRAVAALGILQASLAEAAAPADIAAFDASETLVVIATHPAPAGSVLSIHDATTGARIAAAEFDERTTGLSFCGVRSVMVATETAVHKLDPRTGGHDPVTPLVPGERIAYSSRCDFVAIHKPDQPGITLRSLGTGRRYPFEASPGTISACFAGDDSALVYLDASGGLYEVELKKKKRVQLATPGSAMPAGIACVGKHGLAIGGASAVVRANPAAKQGASIDLPCRFDERSCAVSADGRTLATVRDAAGEPAAVVRFHSTSPMKGVRSVVLPKPAQAVALSPSGSVALVTFAGAPPMIVSRANGALLPLAPPRAAEAAR